MPITVRCKCGTTLRARDEQAGRTCKCPQCGAALGVPYPVAKPIAPPTDEEHQEIPPQPDLPPSASAVTVALLQHRAQGPNRPEPAVPPPPPVEVELSDLQKCDRTFRGHLYWLLLFFVIPITYSTFARDLDIKTIRDKLLQQQQAHASTNPSDPNYVDPAEKFGEEVETFPDVDRILREVPGHRLEGALFARGSYGHWSFAFLASLIFLAIIALALPCEADLKVGHLALAGFFTGTVGVALLLTFQELHMCFCCIGVWYVAALHPGAPFGPSLLGFILGVGVSEEITKCIPVLWRIHRQDIGWREACLIGMASGAGFGISEGIYYATTLYNGLFPMSIYIERFISSCGLHVMLSGACGIMIFRKQKHLGEWYDPYDWVLTLSALMIVPIVLHGLFDALLKVDLPAAAVGVWLASFAWLAWMIKVCRRDELKRLEVTALSASRFVKTEKGTRYVGGEPLY